MIEHVVEQGTLDWYEHRLGLPTASNMHRILTPGGKPSKSETTRIYMLQLIAERLLNISMDDELRVLMMERGKLLQSDAARQFCEVYGLELKGGGFVENPTMKVGASPDALVVGKNEAVEIKCPAAHTLIGYHLDGLGTNYKPQVQAQILAGSFQCVHFYAWHPRCPAFYLRTEPDYEYIEKLRVALNDFNAVLEADTVKARQFGIFLPSDLMQASHEADAVNVLDAG